MSSPLISLEVQCPYCGEQIDVMVDNCGENQQYIEDCQVCCRPINFHITVNEFQQVQVNVYTDDEA
ncbi:MAG: CPXCG motif-containing cysteine-rich protein [Gammaproteobacteria bacterium]|nr:CPXCG motif-containing cysteine-rich protein [Gammaproteobacteria bacterium]